MGDLEALALRRGAAPLSGGASRGRSRRPGAICDAADSRPVEARCKPSNWPATSSERWSDSPDFFAPRRPAARLGAGRAAARRRTAAARSGRAGSVRSADRLSAQAADSDARRGSFLAAHNRAAFHESLGRAAQSRAVARARGTLAQPDSASKTAFSGAAQAGRRYARRTMALALPQPEPALIRLASRSDARRQWQSARAVPSTSSGARPRSASRQACAAHESSAYGYCRSARVIMQASHADGALRRMKRWRARDGIHAGHTLESQCADGARPERRPPPPCLLRAAGRRRRATRSGGYRSAPALQRCHRIDDAIAPTCSRWR